ncbi:hypothetical protein NPX13_g2686 [Xylaria arbuscula]|uniref:C2H2-type domain-containing protein n=1 Tax=Xylaria arbuscula TaxID=114810 RepID=A0A9W8NJL5_9PEZI|nr:hypothetical protein NPX13_g2686 [Xylaria arbuscula]
MSSMYTISPASLHDLSDHSRNYIQPPRHLDSQAKHTHNGPSTPESNLLSPYTSHAHSNSASPTLNTNTNTPADTLSTTECYQSSDIFPGSDYAEDPFLGANFDDVPEDWFVAIQAPENGSRQTVFPLSPDPTPAIPSHQTFQPEKEPTVNRQDSDLSKDYSTQEEPSIDESSQSDPQLTPDTNRGSWSSNDSPAQAALAMATSPRVTVSIWGKEDDAPIQGIERSFTAGGESPCTHRYLGGYMVEWKPNEGTGHRGLAPGERPPEEVPSLNQQAARRERDEKNREVDAWISQSTGNISEDPNVRRLGSDPRFSSTPDADGDNIPAREIPLGHTTENRHIDGQTYFIVDGPGGPINETDFDLMRHLRTWGDAPAIHAIQSDDRKRYQPETSQAAIERFYRQCQDNASIVSKAATWGTRRRSLPSVIDVEGVTSGNFLKKLSISGHSRRPSILQRVTSMSRKASVGGIRKRKGSNASELPNEELGDPVDRRESKDSLAPPSRTSSWGLGGIGNKKPTPSLNTALVGMATSVAVIGTQHARSGSISATPIASPKSPFGSLGVPSLRRPRSKTELPKTSSAELSHPNLVGMLRKQGGPPVAQLARGQPQPDQEDDEDDDDDGMDEMDLKVAQRTTRSIEATLNGFKAHILDINPSLATTDGIDNPNSYLVDRIAYQMHNRYKQLLTAKQKHMNQVNQRNCPSGNFCRSLGGTIRYWDGRGGDRGVDPLSARAISSDEEATPLEGGINAESFPQGITPPPATSLPAEFECPLCFSIKKFQKPSDWTKHVHEDVQPFTCTWDRCRDPKMFKRKADWVRHENEGHRHLEWWTCDVDDCRHICYRRDNFLQHLVREHKFTEPKVKTKAAIKKAGGADHTWQKVEQCHEETTKKPTEEPCRFCGKTFPTWKKLTVHLAKHMEQISLPVVELVMKKELDTDTLISPIQDPPPRHFGIPPPSTPSIKPDPQDISPHVPQISTNAVNYSNATPLGFTPISQAHMGSTYYAQPQTGQPYHDMVQAQYSTQNQYHGLPVTTSTFGQPGTTYAMNMGPSDTEPFPAFDSLGIQDPTGSMNYQNLGNPVLQSVEQYGSNHGSVSPYSHSPHPGHNGQFYSA